MHSMCNLKKRPHWLLAALFMLSISSNGWAQSKTVSMCTEHWPPFVIIQKGDGAISGTWINLLHQLFNNIPGYTLKLVEMPWKRCLLEIKSGRVDGTFSHFKNPEREEYMDFTLPVVSDRSMVWYSVKKFPNAFKWETYQDLAQYNLGVVRGEKYNMEINKLIASNKITSEVVNTETQNFKKLALGRVDIVVKNEKVGWSIVHALKKEKWVKPSLKHAYEKKRYLSFSKIKQHSQLISSLNARIIEMKSSGEIRGVLDYPKN